MKASGFYNELLNHVEELQKTINEIRELIKTRVKEVRVE